MSIATYLVKISTRLSDATAIAKIPVTCATAGSEHEALCTAMDLTASATKHRPFTAPSA